MLEILNISVTILLLIFCVFMRWRLCGCFTTDMGSKKSSAIKWILIIVAVAMLIPTPFLVYEISFALQGLCLIYLLVMPVILSYKHRKAVINEITASGLAYSEPIQNTVIPAACLYGVNKDEKTPVSDDSEANEQNEQNEDEEGKPEAEESEDQGKGKKKKKANKPKKVAKPKKRKEKKQGAKSVQKPVVKVAQVKNCKWYVGPGKRIPVTGTGFTFVMNGGITDEIVQSFLHALSEKWPNLHWTALYDNGLITVLPYMHGERSVVNSESFKSIHQKLPWYIVPLGTQGEACQEEMVQRMEFVKLHQTPEAKQEPVDLNELNVQLAGKSKKNQQPHHKFKEGSWLQTIHEPGLNANRSLLYGRASQHLLWVGSGMTHSLLGYLEHLMHATNSEVYLVSGSNDPTLLSLMDLQDLFVVNDLTGTYGAVKRCLYELNKRYSVLKRLEREYMPLSGNLNIHEYVSINGFVYEPDERMHVRLAYDEKDVEAQDVQPGMEVVIPGDKRFRIPNHWEFANAEQIKNGTTVTYPAMTFVFDEPFALLGNYKELESLENMDANTASPEVMANEIKNAITVLLQYGPSVNMHVVLSFKSLDENFLSERVMNGIDALVLGSLDDESKKAVGRMLNLLDESGESTKVALQSLVDLVDGDVVLVQSMKEDDKTRFMCKTLHAAQADAKSLLSAAGLKGKALQERLLKQDYGPVQFPQLRFDRYDYMLPNEMPKGVVADYGYVGDKRQKSKIVDGIEVDTPTGRKITLNRSSRIGSKQIDLKGLYGDEERLKIGTAVLPSVPKMEREQADDSAGVLTMDVIEQISEGAEKREHDDPGRVDSIGEGIDIVGDQTSLNSVYSQVVDDEADDFHIVK